MTVITQKNSFLFLYFKIFLYLCFVIKKKIMEAKKNDWLIKVSYVDENLQYVVRYINFLNVTKREVLRSIQSLPENSVVHIYKLDEVL